MNLEKKQWFWGLTELIKKETFHANKFSFSTERHFVLHWKLWNGSDLDETAIINDIWQENESDMCLASKRRSESWVFFCSHLQNYNIIICNTAYVSEHSLWISVSLSNLKEKNPKRSACFHVSVNFLWTTLIIYRSKVWGI